jgi:hypothetical protein
LGIEHRVQTFSNVAQFDRHRVPRDRLGGLQAVRGTQRGFDDPSPLKAATAQANPNSAAGG